MHDLAQRRVAQIIGRERVLRFSKLLGCGPRSDPVRLCLSKRVEDENQKGRDKRSERCPYRGASHDASNLAVVSGKWLVARCGYLGHR